MGKEISDTRAAMSIGGATVAMAMRLAGFSEDNGAKVSDFIEKLVEKAIEQGLPPEQALAAAKKLSEDPAFVDVVSGKNAETRKAYLTGIYKAYKKAVHEVTDSDISEAKVQIEDHKALFLRSKSNNSDDYLGLEEPNHEEDLTLADVDVDFSSGEPSSTDGTVLAQLEGAPSAPLPLPTISI